MNFPKTNILKQLEIRLSNEPDSPHSTTLRNLVKALCMKERHDLAALYELTHEDFKLAMSIMENWRLDQFTGRKDRLRELADLPVN
jgi:hypothetical protein